MSDKRRVFIVHSSYDYEKMFKTHGWEITKTMEDADLIQFTGGSDVTPSFYNEPAHSTTVSNLHRDEVERDIFNLAQGMGIPCAGICRGGQFLNVMNGGSLWQNVDGHATGKMHKAFAIGHIGDVMVTSTHHQMMRTNSGKEYILLMTANEATKKECMSENGYSITRYTVENNKDDDVEAIYYPENNCLCFQPHPEFQGAKECATVYFYFINNYLMKELDIEQAVQFSKVKWQ